MATPTSVDDYLAALPHERRAAMEAIRRTIRAAAPDAVEVISYQMPAFRRRGRYLIAYGAFKNHFSIFPGAGGGVHELGAEVAPYVGGKGTISFPAAEALPLALIARIVRIVVAENDARSAR